MAPLTKGSHDDARRNNAPFIWLRLFRERSFTALENDSSFIAKNGLSWGSGQACFTVIRKKTP